MQNKKLILLMGVLVVAAGGAAFVTGRLLNQKVGPVGPSMSMGGKSIMSISVNVTPAPELPTTRPDVMGQFAERKDNSISVQTFSPGSGGGAVVAQGAGGKVQTVGGEEGPKVEVVVTSQTVIYHETTQPSGPPSSKNTTIQQTVEEGTLDDINSQSMIMVWGHKSGDRIIAEVLLYSNPVMFKRP